LTEKYRDFKTSHCFIHSTAQRYAYLATRMPATYAAIAAVFTAMLERLPSESIKTILDVGAGPGTATWAACNLFPSIERMTLIERDPHLITIGRTLAVQSPLEQAQWITSSMEQSQQIEPHDLIIFSYSLSELPTEVAQQVLQTYWSLTKQVLVIIEPGTPHHFEKIRAWRAYLIAQGGHILAPCPHHAACPMPSNDWCHFSVRLQRSFLHRRIKNVSLGYEDEKFSYVAFAKQPYALPYARVVEHPHKHSGHVNLRLCVCDGHLKETTVSKRQGEHYKQARKLEWGSPLDFF
jgi:ribosomal protein RSM22 (predicted rRNA methylase)